MIADEIIQGVAAYLEANKSGTAISTLTIKERDHGADNTYPAIVVREAGDPQEHEVIRGNFTAPIEVAIRTKPEGDEAATTHRTYTAALADLLTDNASLKSYLQSYIICHDIWHGQGETDESDGYRETTLPIDVFGLAKDGHSITELADFGECGWLYIMQAQCAARSTGRWVGGIQPDKKMVLAHYDTVTDTVTRKTDLYTNNKLDDHSPAASIAVPGTDLVIFAQTEHANASAEDVRIYLSTDGTMANTTLKATVAGTKPTYIQMHLDDNRLFLITRYGGNVLSEWRLLYVEDISADTWTPTDTPLFSHSYITTVPAHDGSGIHVFASAPPNTPTGVGSNDITGAMVWTQNVAYGFIRFSDDAFLVNGQVEIADVKVAASYLHLQSRNLLEYTDEFTTGWTRSSVGEFISMTVVNRWGATDLTSPASRGVYKLTATGGDKTHKVTTAQTFSAAVGEKYTASLYISNISDFDKIYIAGHENCMAGAVDPWAKFRAWGEGIVHSSGTGVTAGIESVGNGWYRCWITYTVEEAVSSVAGMTIALQNDSWTSSFNDNNKGVHIQGAQLESGEKTLYVGVPNTSRNTTQEPVQVTSAAEDFGLWLIAAQQIKEGFVELVWQEQKGFAGINASNHDECFYYYGRLNLSTLALDSPKEKIALTGYGSGNQVNYTGLACIIDVRKVIFGQNDLSGAGTNYLKLWDGTHEFELASSATRKLMRPEPVMTFDSSSSIVPKTDEFVYLSGVYDDLYTNWTSLEAKLAKLT